MLCSAAIAVAAIAVAASANEAARRERKVLRIESPEDCI
jgi:hypothetical protein